MRRDRNLSPCASPVLPSGHSRRARVVILLPALLGGLPWLMVPLPGQGQETPKIYTCVDPEGRRISSDRPIPECLSREQHLLGRDGTPRGVMPPLLSREELARREVELKEQTQVKAAQNENVRHDRMLLTRYPDQKAWDTAKQRAMAPVQARIDAARKRLESLAKEMAALNKERDALGGKSLSADLRSRISINEGSTAGQRSVLQNQTDELARVASQFDQEKIRLDGLWRGLPPGFGEAEPAAGSGKPASGADPRSR